MSYKTVNKNKHIDDIYFKCLKHPKLSCLWIGPNKEWAKEQAFYICNTFYYKDSKTKILLNHPFTISYSNGSYITIAGLNITIHELYGLNGWSFEGINKYRFLARNSTLDFYMKYNCIYVSEKSDMPEFVLNLLKIKQIPYNFKVMGDKYGKN